jgi:hypothetical protein
MLCSGTPVEDAIAIYCGWQANAKGRGCEGTATKPGRKSMGFQWGRATTIGIIDTNREHRARAGLDLLLTYANTTDR